MIRAGQKKRTWEQELKELLSHMTLEERLRFMVRYAHAMRRRKKDGEKRPPRFWGGKKQHWRAL